MPENQAPDDIFALFSQFDLDMSQYRVFHRENPKLERPAAFVEGPAEEVAALEIPPPVTVAVEIEKEPVHPVLVPRQTVATKTPTRVVLNGLRRSLQAAHNQSTNLIAAPVAVIGCAGGAGVTTVAATLARHLSRDGERCAVYDEAPESLLPIFFGNQQIATRHNRFAGLHSVLAPTVRFLTPDVCNEVENDPNAAALSKWERLTRYFGSDFEYMVFDGGREEAASFAGLRVCVAVPDVASVVGMQRLVSSNPGGTNNTICVLNKFDNNQALHQELRCWYEEQFSVVITVDYSALVGEAMAEGMTVLDWAPQSDIAADLLRVAAAVRRSAQKLNVTTIAKTQPEGLALCS